VKLFIPCRLFFNAFSRQPANERQRWPEYFRFGDSGAELIPDVVLLESQKPPNGMLSELERAVLSAIASQSARSSALVQQTFG
jgi:hypothetical protein